MCVAPRALSLALCKPECPSFSQHETKCTLRAGSGPRLRACCRQKNRPIKKKRRGRAWSLFPFGRSPPPASARLPSPRPLIAHARAHQDLAPTLPNHVGTFCGVTRGRRAPQLRGGRAVCASIGSLSPPLPRRPLSRTPHPTPISHTHRARTSPPPPRPWTPCRVSRGGRGEEREEAGLPRRRRRFFSSLSPRLPCSLSHARSSPLCTHSRGRALPGARGQEEEEEEKGGRRGRGKRKKGGIEGWGSRFARNLGAGAAESGLHGAHAHARTHTPSSPAPTPYRSTSPPSWAT